MSKQYDAADEGSHDPATDDADWQESVFVHWYDRNAGIGGVSRIGHEPNRPGGGRSALQCFVATGRGIRFRRNDFQLPFVEASTPRGFRAGGSQWHVDSGAPRLVIDEPGCSVDLTMDNFYPLTDFFPSASSMAQDFAKDHYETSGRIRGMARIDGRSFEVDGMYHRDHSWGVRKTMTLKSHRWISGTFGPDLSFGSILWHASDESLVKVGYLVRDGEIHYATDVDAITYLEPDGLTHRGGEVTWSMPDGEVLTLQADVMDAVVAHLHNVYYVDSICDVRHPTTDQRWGICDFEISNNARLGTSPALTAINAALDEGITKRA
ncbi:propanediol utilization protein [Mycobacteroides franklinii]|uniref:Propanediol utilization protein n=1 Tax=Mycobacteroides franklinii TaxID=948102 RepID=A0A4R5PCI6_9MYCO|nr:propanediol utilization protein [Mycobacteroides franklinii]ORA62995.1 propanediol utilization protein [Mycobacteroides franklinii]TDH22402.1 propanediol utilization protein [Mycobacteroides franklinii]